jgi:putative transposase
LIWSHCVLSRATEADHRQHRAAKGIAVLGRAKVLEQNPFDYPQSNAPRFQMSPRVAARNRWARIEALLRYRAAFLRHMAGLANVLFPFGTFWMRKFAKVACEVADRVDGADPGKPMNPVPA